MIKKLPVPVLCILVGCAGGAAMGSVTAQTWPEPATAQRWQQECEPLEGFNSSERVARALNPIMRRRGDAGWEFVGNPYPSHALACFKRPAP